MSGRLASAKAQFWLLTTNRAAGGDEKGTAVYSFRVHRGGWDLYKSTGVIMRCHICSFEMPENAGYCGGCGAPVLARRE